MDKTFKTSSQDIRLASAAAGGTKPTEIDGATNVDTDTSSDGSATELACKNDISRQAGAKYTETSARDGELKTVG